MARYHLTDKDRQNLRDQKRLVESLYMQPTGVPYSNHRDNVTARIVLTPDGGIDAMAGGVPGSADCKAVKIDENDSIATIESTQLIKVWNVGSKLPANEYVLAVKDPWSRWLAFQVLSGTGAAWFKTNGSGVPAAGAPDQPASAQAERMKFDGNSIVSADDPPAFEIIWNGAPAAVRANDFVQCARIDGEWFVNVEYCRE